MMLQQQRIQKLEMENKQLIKKNEEIMFSAQKS